MTTRGQPKPAHYTGSYDADAKAIRDAAYADPLTRCWWCNKTLAEHGQPWQAGHLNDGEVGGPMAAECRKCNASRGGKLGNQRRYGLKTTRRW